MARQAVEISDNGKDNVILISGTMILDRLILTLSVWIGPNMIFFIYFDYFPAKYNVLKGVWKICLVEKIVNILKVTFGTHNGKDISPTLMVIIPKV